MAARTDLGTSKRSPGKHVRALSTPWSLLATLTKVSRADSFLTTPCSPSETMKATRLTIPCLRWSAWASHDATSGLSKIPPGDICADVEKPYVRVLIECHLGLVLPRIELN